MSMRYQLCYVGIDNNNNTVVLNNSPFRYTELSDTIVHICKENETLFDIAGYYYKDNLPSASMYYDIIADFQPEPILDPTQPLEVGRKIYIPSPVVVQNIIESTNRQYEYENW